MDEEIAFVPPLATYPGYWLPKQAIETLVHTAREGLANADNEDDSLSWNTLDQIYEKLLAILEP